MFDERENSRQPDRNCRIIVRRFILCGDQGDKNQRLIVISSDINRLKDILLQVCCARSYSLEQLILMLPFHVAVSLPRRFGDPIDDISRVFVSLSMISASEKFEEQSFRQ